VHEGLEQNVTRMLTVMEQMSRNGSCAEEAVHYDMCCSSSTGHQ
jgi:hypothetical protein